MYTNESVIIALATMEDRTGLKQVAHFSASATFSDWLIDWVAKSELVIG